MKYARISAFTPLILAALWLPKSIASWMDYGRLDAAQVFALEAATPHFWSGRLAALVLMALVFGWFFRGIDRRPTLQLSVLVVIAMALRIAAASLAQVQNDDAVLLDALCMSAAGLLAEGVVFSSRAVRNDPTAPKKGDGWGPWLVYLLLVSLGAAGSFATVICLSLALEASHMPVALAWFGVFPIVAVCVMLHEGGHYLGARLSGMKVAVMRVLAVECHPRRGWWLIRWSPKSNRSYRGYVYALPDPERPMRGQMIAMILMGPLANAIVCAAAILIAYYAPTPQVENVLAAFAVMNGVMAMGNLLPREGRMKSDGAQLLWWWRHKDDQKPELAYIRLLSRSLFGTTADALDEADIHYLENQPMPVPLLAMWYRLKAAQNRVDWTGALQIGERFEEALNNWENPQAEFQVLIAHVRAEVVFSSAITTGEHDALNESLLTRDLKQLCPYLWPRCLALKAFLVGSEEEGQRLLQFGLREANRSIDLALGKSERMLGRYIMDLRRRPGDLARDDGQWVRSRSS
jgi:Zn-dependent protease